jgi:hypothetical protein
LETFHDIPGEIENVLLLLLFGLVAIMMSSAATAAASPPTASSAAFTAPATAAEITSFRHRFSDLSLERYDIGP